ncbi:MAG TPA: DUF1328 domain-containing protein [Rhizomicrobium sp.]|nr:DUF1328 domain-containing protein [Rhizomicrobium sp.]
MVGWALIFLALSLAAGYLGFFAFGEPDATLAKVFFVVFSALSILGAATGLIRKRPDSGRKP